jgi:hypothetical protein
VYPESQWAKQQQFGSRQITKKSVSFPTKEEGVKRKNIVLIIVGM